MKKIFLLVLICLVAMSLEAQNSVLITKNYNGQSFSAFVDALEKNGVAQFFFEDSVTANITISQYSDTAVLADVLKASLDTNLYFAIDPQHNVVITKNYEISVSPPVYFYNFKEKKKDDEEEFSSFLVEKPKKQRATYGKTIIIGNPEDKNVGKSAILRGAISENQTGDPIIGAIIWIESLKIGTTTDYMGQYFFEVPKGKYEIEISSVGFETAKQNVVVNGDGNLNLVLNESVTQLADVTVMAGKIKNVQGLQMGLDKIEIKTVKQLPAALGEVDVIKAAIMLPGVQTVGEGASGFNVRGGSTDQNLILFDQAPVFNSSHLFGFFSAFNPDVLRDFSLYKSAIPSEYGDRVSSVFDISSTSGNKSKWGGNVGISPVSLKAMVDGHIGKKTTLLGAFRTTYSDWLLDQVDNTDFSNSDASFYDWNVKLKHNFNEKNTLQLSVYNSKDKFRLKSDTTFKYSNTLLSLHYNHVFNDRFYVNIYDVYSNYIYNIESDKNKTSLDYRVDYEELKAKFVLQIGAINKLNFGISDIFYNIEPSVNHNVSDSSKFVEKDIEHERADEVALYVEDEIKLTERIGASFGVRLNEFMAFGPKTVYKYDPTIPMNKETIIDSVFYPEFKTIKTYFGFEPRVNLRYTINENNSVKASYNRINQYIHMLSNTTAISPTDMWKLSDYHIKPLIGDMFSIGYYRDLKEHVIEASAEFYYKKTKNVIEYKGGAELFDNPFLEADLLSGDGRSYGVELLLKKKFGYFNGWIAYTYSRSEIKVDGDSPEEKINGGKYFPTNYDKPHDFTLVVNNKFSRRLSLSNSITYSTGRPITYPVAVYDYNGNRLFHYSDRNEYRIPNYFRWDISLNIEGNLKSKKIAHSSWTIAVYNLTGRNNVYSEYFKVNEFNEVQGYRMSIFAKPIPTITYNMKF